MKKFVTLSLTLALVVLFGFSLYAQDRFDRSAVIHAEADDIGGFGNVIAGADLDGDGKVEMYTVNNDWYDVAGKDWVPRIYKYEKNDKGRWEIVWWTRLAINFQNTWPALAFADLDKDGKGEVVFGPVNNLKTGNLNPNRIVVFETVGDGSDVMGIDNGDGTFSPNAAWSIATADEVELRPFRWIIYDLDGDGTDEIVTAARRGDGVQIYSVDNIPDNGDGSETWTIEFSGVAGTHYDIAIMNGSAYGIRSDGTVTKVWWNADSARYEAGTPQADVVPNGSWKSATTVDLDNDGTEEFLVASWSSSTSNVYLVQEDGDTLKTTLVKDVPDEAHRLYGGAAGDFDSDGLTDFMFGSRQSTPLGLIFRLEYQGGDITDPANYELSVMDHGVNPALQYDIMTVANVDDDSDDEPIYSGLPRGLSEGQTPPPVVVLDRIPGNQPIVNMIADIPGDQGRQVRVNWVGAADDSPDGGAETITMYTVWRKVDAMGKRIGDDTKVMRIANAMWEQVGETVAVQKKEYALVVPTLVDRTEENPGWSVFGVIAHTADPAVHWMSFPKRGFSVDNLVPTAPQNVTAKEVEPQTGIFAVELTWEEIPDEDFNYYAIVRGAEAGFDPEAAEIIGTTTEPVFTDESVNVGENFFYRVVAFDFNGNQGVFSDEVSATVTGVEDQPSVIPSEFSLSQNYPNPFNPSTQINYDLAEATRVTVEIYNLMGQKVRELVNQTQPAGRYTVTWDATNDAGVRVSTGTYIYVLRTKQFTASKRMVLLK